MAIIFLLLSAVIVYTFKNISTSDKMKCRKHFITAQLLNNNL